jgi:hypothetical protein
MTTTMNLPLIGLTGQKQAGKDTVSKHQKRGLES